MKKRLIKWVSFAFLWSAGHTQVLHDSAEAFDQAGKKGLPLLLIFSGSDWCQPCIRFDRTILQDSNFIRFAGDHLVLLKADFPQRKKLSPGEVKQNETLAALYNPSGKFPFFLLLKPDGTVMHVVLYEEIPAREFILRIRAILFGSAMIKEFIKKEKLMGSSFEFRLVAEEEEAMGFLEMAVSEVRRIEELLTEFKPTSQTSLINRFAGLQPVEVDVEVYELIRRCRDISKMTSGAFDITAGPLKKLYDFRGANFELPGKEKIKEALTRVGYEKIRLVPPNKVMLLSTGMSIGFGAIGKGYAADKAKALLQKSGVKSGVINASGDLSAWGLRPDGLPWNIGIADPGDETKIVLWLPLTNMTVATSGNYIQYFIRNGVRYSHNIDPNTGLPVRGIQSATVISPAAELSDALATAVSVMGVKAGISLINQLPSTHCLVVDEKNKLHGSNQIHLNSLA